MLMTDPVAAAKTLDQTEILARFAFVQTLAREAGSRALSFYETRDTLEVESKGLQDRVTMADRAVEDYIRTAIAERYPDDGFLGEESGTSADLPSGQGTIWVVDPIDGTDCFVFGMPTWCVSIACISNGVIQLGAIFDPVHNELFAAARDQGAFANGAQLRISDADHINAGLVGIGHSTRIDPDISLGALERLIKGGGMFHRCGSGALSLAWVAAGRLIGYHEPHMNSWDCLAGLVLVEEAGGWVNDFLAGDGLLSGNPVLAAAPGIIEQMKHVAGHERTDTSNRPAGAQDAIPAASLSQ